MFSDLKHKKLVLQGCSVNQINQMIWIKKEHKTGLCPSLPHSLFSVRLTCFTDTADSVGLQTTASALLKELMLMLRGEDLLLLWKGDV